MAVIKRAEVAEPVLPKQTVEVQALGGDVVVRGLLLTEYLALQERMAELARAAKAGEGGVDGVRAVLPVLLAIAVLDADDQPVFTEAQWQVFGAKHTNQAISLFNVAWDLSGFNQAATAKN